MCRMSWLTMIIYTVAAWVLYQHQIDAIQLPPEYCINVKLISIEWAHCLAGSHPLRRKSWHVVHATGYSQIRRTCIRKCFMVSLDTHSYQRVVVRISVLDLTWSGPTHVKSNRIIIQQTCVRPIWNFPLNASPSNVVHNIASLYTQSNIKMGSSCTTIEDPLICSTCRCVFNNPQHGYASVTHGPTGHGFTRKDGTRVFAWEFPDAVRTNLTNNSVVTSQPSPA